MINESIRIPLGMPSLIETDTVEDCVALCKKLDLQFIELNLNFPQYLLKNLDVDKLKRLAKENDLFYTIHFDDNMNIADFNPYISDGYCRTAKDTIALAKELRIPVLNMHMNRGACYTMPHKKVFFFEVYKEEYLKNIRAFRDQCTAAIGDSGIRICIENSDGFTDFQREAVDAMLESPAFGLTIDIGHNYCTNCVDESFIFDRIDRLYHMHIHDAKDGKKDHQALGTGELDLKRFFGIGCENHCTVVLETKTIAGLEESVNWLRQAKF